MSSIYVLEPPTKGKVVLTTTAGALDFELWPKEAPKAVRNFVQLCLEGYYNGTVFHRIIKTFMIQGGDPTGSGTGGDTIYGEPFIDEFHSRLRFNHRGLVACANAGSANSNNSQFFMTLDRCDWLDKKHTIFGKVTGETIYNLLKLGELETDPDDRPLDPPKILSVEVLWNPFDDIVPRASKISAGIGVIPNKTARRKGKKELNLLSFGEEAEQEEQQLANVKEKIKSSHDVLEDPRLLKSESEFLKVDEVEARRRRDVQASVRQALGGLGKTVVSEKESHSQENEDYEQDFDSKMREQVLQKKLRLAVAKPAAHQSKRVVRETTSEIKKTSSISEADMPSSTNKNEEFVSKKEKLTIKKKGLGSEGRAEAASKADVDLQLLSPLEQQRQQFKQRKKTVKDREENTLAKLEMFKKKLVQSKEGTGGTLQTENDQVEASNWLAHNLKFEVDTMKRDDMAKSDDPNQYVVHDPLLEKGKEKFNRMQAKMKRKGREWAGKSLD